MILERVCHDNHPLGILVNFSWMFYALAIILAARTPEFCGEKVVEAQFSKKIVSCRKREGSVEE